MTIDDEYTNASFRLVFTDFNTDGFIDPGGFSGIITEQSI